MKRTTSTSAWLLVFMLPLIAVCSAPANAASGGPNPPAPTGMVLVPGGEYWIGSPFPDAAPDQAPFHPVHVDTFFMDRTETTNAQYVAALNWAIGQGLIQVESGLIRDAESDIVYADTLSGSAYSRIVWDGAAFASVAGKEDHPAASVSWYGAAAYANWRSAMEGRPQAYDVAAGACNFVAGAYRLATEAEWETAARGGLDNPPHRFPWGDTLVGSDANFLNSGDPFEVDGYPWTTPVAYYDGGQAPAGADMANGYGLYDMAGNVYEWCNDWYGATYFETSPYENPRGPATGATRLLRGGGWYSSSPLALHCAFRYSQPPTDRFSTWGMRLVLNAACPNGDWDCDGVFDAPDHAALAACLFGPNAAPDPAAPVAAGDCLAVFDADTDDDVDLNDFAALQALISE